MYFSQSGDQKPESKVPCWLGSEACAFPGLKIADFSLYPHVVGELSSLTSLLIRAFTPFLRASSSRFRSLPKASLPNAITLGIRTSTILTFSLQQVSSWCRGPCVPQMLPKQTQAPQEAHQPAVSANQDHMSSSPGHPAQAQGHPLS